MNEHLGDLLYLDTHDGKRLVVDERVKFPVYGNFGAPPIEFITTRGYKQHGSTFLDFLLGERSISIDLMNNAATDRQTYWDVRYDLHQYLRPNRGGPLTVVLEIPNGQRYALHAWPNPGLILPPPSDNSWMIQETIDFRCLDPVWFTPDTTILTPAGITGDHLVFPITFPIQFGPGGTNFSSGVIAYTGTWPAYPIITLTGPYTAARVENQETAVRVEMVVAVGAGQTRIIDLTPGAIRIVDQNGVDRFDELGPGSDLIHFNIRPDPDVPAGQQTILINMTGASGASAAEIRYNTRFFAI